MIRIKAPGRICLFGEHQDYLNYPVIAMAISKYIYLEAKKIIEPMCNECGGFLKPSVVFFGDFLPEEEFDLAESIAEDSNAVIVAGTSMKVGTATSLITSVKKRGPVIVINRGETMVDHMADVKINAGVGETLQDIMRGLL